MAKFLVKASYSAEGAKGVQSAGGSSRRDVIAEMAEVGTIGKLHERNPFRLPGVRINRAKGVSLMATTQGWASTLSADRMRPSRWTKIAPEISRVECRWLNIFPR